MPQLTVSAALSDNVRTRPMLDGTVTVEGIRLVTSGLHPSEMFWRQLHFADFDVAEMSLSSLLIMADRAGGVLEDWVAIPVFSTRRWFHTGILIRVDSGISSPADLKGKRVGVPEYQQTAAVWSRGYLADQHSVNPTMIHWFMERPAGLSHASATGFSPPSGVKLSYIKPPDSLGKSMLAGRLDATLHYLRSQNLVDRSRDNLNISSQIRPLFPNQHEEAARAFAATGLFPINHAVVIRRHLVEAHPWITLNLYSAFERANKLARRVRDSQVEAFAEPGFATSEGAHAYPYGLGPNQIELATLSRYAWEQGLVQHQVDLSSLFDRRTAEV